MSELTLYEIGDEWQALMNSLDTCETAEQRAECEARLQQTANLLVRKVDNFSRFLAHLESQQALAANEIERLKTRQHELLRSQQRLEEYAVHVMQEMNVKKLEGDTSRLSLRQNASAVEITDAAQVPAQFKTIHQTVSVDKRAIKKALESGDEVPGCDLRYGTVSLVRR